MLYIYSDALTYQFVKQVKFYLKSYADINMFHLC